nr:hypothetical protein [Tanacetum cinerariifolium]
MANNQNHALLFHLDLPTTMKQRKQENNLINWKWDAVIVIEDLDAEVKLLSGKVFLFGKKISTTTTMKLARMMLLFLTKLLM